jgi:microcystin-dependent protein
MATLASVVTSNSGGTVPVGTIVAFGNNTAPTGFIKCNGAQISRTVYSDLFAAITTVFGAGNGSTTFTLPDLRGEFVRGWDDARTVDNGRAIGSYQGGNVGSHTHNVSVYRYSINYQGHYTPNNMAHGEYTSTVTSDSGTQTGETRPRNVALLYCIKY